MVGDKSNAIDFDKLNANHFNKWNAAKAEVRFEELYRVEKTPYSGLILVQDRHKPSPREHYPEAVMWIS